MLKDNFYRLFSPKKKADPVNDNQTLLRAERAYRTLRQEGFNEALAEVENSLWDRFFSSAAQDVEAREALFHHIKGVQLVKAQLETFVQQGELVKHLNTRGQNK